MKEYKYQPPLILRLEKDDEGNLSGMQARVWKMNNGTTIFLRIFEHSEEARDNLWDKTRTVGQVSNSLLEMLKNFEVIKETENWEYSVSEANKFSSQDEFEEKHQCHYFCWNVRPEYLKF